MSTFSPRDPDWERRVRDIFAAAPFVEALGIEPVSLAPGAVTARLAVARRHLQQDGYVHAGVQATLADHSAGAAAATLMAAAAIVLTVEFKISLLRPARGAALVCRARVLRAGRSLTFCQSDVFALDGGDEKQVASVSVTLAQVARPS
jgi:uncharacterized protein (TIGR00369 family)